MKAVSLTSIALATLMGPTMASAQIKPGGLVPGGPNRTPAFSWRYYRPSNTGIQGDYCDALEITPQGLPWIGGYDASFEEGGISSYDVRTDRWSNISNVDFPVIGHPEQQGCVRVADISVDGTGKLWMATGSGGLFYDPAKGPKSLRRFDASNSGVFGGWNRTVEIAPDGTIWFAAYATVWGDGGVARYNPTTNTWASYPGIGEGYITIRPKASSAGYFVWASFGQEIKRFDSSTGTWSTLPTGTGQAYHLPGKDLTDSAGNTWASRWTNFSLFESKLDILRSNGTWANLPTPPFGNNYQVVKATAPNQALVATGDGQIWKYDGSTWQDLGTWNNTFYTMDIGIDGQGNVWACGVGGAARRDASTGVWQRYRVTNTSMYDFFSNDLSLDADGGVWACANAGPGTGGLAHFIDGRWKGVNNLTYGLGDSFPFNSDNSQLVYHRPSTDELLANPTYGGLHSFAAGGWQNLNSPTVSPEAVLEDKTGRLWLGDTTGIYIRQGSTWVQVSTQGVEKLALDPQHINSIWGMGFDTIMRIDAVDASKNFTRKVEDFPELDTQSDQFKGFAVDKNGFVWLGANTINLPLSGCVFKINPASGSYVAFDKEVGWPFPGEYVMPLAATKDGRVWMQYSSDYLVEQAGLFGFDGTNVVDFPAPFFGDPQWGGLPHASIADLEVREGPGFYELWMSCLSRGIAVLKVKTAL